VSAEPAVDWSSFRAVLFDLDGVLTPTAEVHMRAWSEMFNQFLAAYEPGEQGTGASVRVDTSPYTDADYFAHVDGKPRYEGVRDFLASRGIVLPEGESGADGGAGGPTVRSLGDRKNAVVQDVLARDGVAPYAGSVALLDHLRHRGVPLAVVSSSANAPAVLAASGLADRFTCVVDGAVARDVGLPGKPEPDTFLHAAAVLGVSAREAVVVEDAVSGVRAGVAGAFGLVVGVDRGAGDALRAAGADVVVPDLADLLPDGRP